MNDQEQNELEAELRSFSPLPASAELRDRVAGELEAGDAPQAVRRDRLYRLARASRFTAAVVILIAIGFVLWQRFMEVEDRLPQPDPRGVVQDEEIPPEPADSPPPTLWAYRLAAMDSPRDLDLLLDQHARMLLPRDDDLVCARDQIH